MSEVYIYALVDPRNDQVRYVGQIYQPKTRLVSHCNPGSNRGDGPKQVWVRGLLSLNLKPIMKILETVEGSNPELKFKANKAERNWINYFAGSGANLFNDPNHPAPEVFIDDYFAEPYRSTSLKLKRSVYNQLEVQAKAAGKTLADYLESFISESIRGQEAA